MAGMRAAWYERQGAPRDVLKVGELPVPEPGPGEVQVRVYASGVNPSDTYGRSGIHAPMAFPRVVPHQDGAGVVEKVGQGVDPGRVGERVWIYEATQGRSHGTAAEYTVVPADRAVRLPDGMSFAEGACLGIPAQTSHRCVFADGPVTGQTVLVTGGAGAVGNYAIQWAKWGGAALVLSTISSDAKAAAAREAGADHTIDYKHENAAEAIRRLVPDGVDRIVDVDFGGNLPTTLEVLRTNGTVASYASRGNPDPALPWRRVMTKNMLIRPVLLYTMPESAKRAAAADIARAVSDGALHHAIGRRLPLDQVAEAHELVEKGAVIGNVVLEIRQE